MTGAGFVALSAIIGVLLWFGIWTALQFYDRNAVVRARVLKRREDIFYVRVWLAVVLSLIVGLPALLLWAAW